MMLAEQTICCFFFLVAKFNQEQHVTMQIVSSKNPSSDINY